MRCYSLAMVSNAKLERVNMNLPVKLVNRVKNYARANGLPNTQAYVILLNNALKENTMLENMPSLLNALNDIISLTKTDKK